LGILFFAKPFTREVPKREKRQTPLINNAINLTNFSLCAFNFEKSKVSRLRGFIHQNQELN
jgi:hypothetical protein